MSRWDAGALAAALGTALDRSWDRESMTAYSSRRTWARAAEEVYAELSVIQAEHGSHQGAAPRATWEGLR